MTPVPVVLVAGIDAAAMEITTLAAQWDVPRTAVVRHDLDPASGTLTRVVSSADGVLETHVVHLDHGCTACALREDVLPTLLRLAHSGRWDVLVAHLPTTADPVLVTRAMETSVVDGRPLRESARVGSVVVAVDGEHLVDDVLGDDHLVDRGLGTSPEDDRGVGETLAGQLEYADVVVLTTEPDGTGRELLEALRRPDCGVVDRPSDLDGTVLVAGVRSVRRADAWIDPLGAHAGPLRGGDVVWTRTLESWRPFHPERLVQNIELLGGGPRRSRGCFWVPGRTTAALWDGAGGQLCVGPCSSWGDRAPHTRIAVCGVDDDVAELEAAFEATLMTDAELAAGLGRWQGRPDGLEPWLGAVDDQAA
ncbi:CobW family GTP-binding protein [Solicola sp. PLA-1-18]|uniref:CobW family GTP-binding protein n=1 Tax=Solicola sp. PLA-1-18 TaxID=3380532 RepID=UPI003B7FA9E3